jgi:hypothetical protein
MFGQMWLDWAALAALFATFGPNHRWVEKAAQAYSAKWNPHITWSGD